MKKRERLIKKHLEELERLKKKLPKSYHPFEGVSVIYYGFANRKTITPEEIDEYRRRR